jgi:hypothetical protein
MERNDMANMVDLIERNELIQKIVDSGFSQLVEALLYNEARVYTKKGRLNKSGACRVLGWKTKQLEDALAECRRILGEDQQLIPE